MMDKLDQMATQILAGMLSNPSILAPHHQYGFGLVNVTESQLSGYAVAFAYELIDAIERPRDNGLTK
jgi:hypothetical protein